MRIRHILLVGVGVIGLSSLAAAQLSTLATAAIEAPVRELAKDFSQQTGHEVKLQFDTSPNIARRLAAGEESDVLIVSKTAADQAIKEGKAVAGGRAAIGKVGLGVALSHGGRRPDISTVDGLKASLRQADTVLFSQGASGLLVEKMLKDIGIADEIKAKTVVTPSGNDLMKRLGTATKNEIGFTMVSEIKAGESHGGSLVGPVPEAIQTYTAYDAVVMSHSAAKDQAQAFIGVLTSAKARQLLGAAGWQF